jgi:hypothetical protein
MEKDPDEVTVISSGSGRGFSGEKEHLVLSEPEPDGTSAALPSRSSTSRICIF